MGRGRTWWTEPECRRRGPSGQARGQALDVRWMNNGMQQQAYHIDHDVAFLAFDLFARIIAVWINAGPPFPVLFTLWLSITQAVGLASRPIIPRHFT